MEAFLKEHPFITGVIIGEGEKTFSELCRYYVKGEGSLEEMKGIALFDGAGNVQIHESQEILDMNTIPFCYDLSEDFPTGLSIMNPAGAVRSVAAIACPR